MRTRGHLMFFILVAALVAGPASHVQGAEMPTLEVMAANVITASTSPTGYQVRVVQTETQEPATKSTLEGTASLTTEAPVSSPYLIIFDPAAPLERFSTEDAPAVDTTGTESLSSLQSDSTQTQAGGTVRITVDVTKLFPQLMKMPHVFIAEEVKDGRMHFRLSGEHDDGTAVSALIDAERWYLSEITVTVLGHPFSHTALTYRDFGKFWLPSRIVIYHFADGSRVTQDFDQYQFAP